MESSNCSGSPAPIAESACRWRDRLNNAGGLRLAPLPASETTWRSAPLPPPSPAGNAPRPLLMFGWKQADRFRGRSVPRRGTPSTTPPLAPCLSASLRGTARALPISPARALPASCSLAPPCNSPIRTLPAKTPPRKACPSRAARLTPSGFLLHWRRIAPRPGGCILRRRRRSHRIRHLLHVPFFAVIQRIGWSQRDPVSGIQPVQNFQCHAVIASDRKRLQMRMMIRVHHHGSQPFRPEEQGIDRYLQPLARHLHVQMHLRVASRQ